MLRLTYVAAATSMLLIIVIIGHMIGQVTLQTRQPSHSQQCAILAHS
jgi:hypothetical protein